MVKSFEEVKERLLAFPVKRKIGVAAAHDEHTLDAVVMAARDGLVEHNKHHNHNLLTIH